MFQGLHQNLLDEKGRVAFPAALRGAVQEECGSDTLILTQSFYERCLVVLVEEVFRAKAERVQALPPSNPAVMAFKRVVIASATKVNIDKAGRIGVPKELRDYAGLEREVVFAGVIDSIEMWSKARWDEENTRRLSDRGTLAEYREFLEGHGL